MHVTHDVLVFHKLMLDIMQYYMWKQTVHNETYFLLPVCLKIWWEVYRHPHDQTLWHKHYDLYSMCSIEIVALDSEIFNLKYCTFSHTQQWVMNKVHRSYQVYKLLSWSYPCDRLCGLVVRVSGYRYRGLGFDSRRYQIFWVVVGLERGPLSLVRSIEELLE